VAPIANEEDEDEDDDRLFLALAGERANRAAECALCAMYIMTSKNMNKRVYIDDVIDKVAMFLRFQLQNTIYPSFDPVYKELSKVGFMRHSN
jgi:cohesin loading factor subunit SCC2